MMYYGGMGWGWAIVCMVAVAAIIAAVVWAIVYSANQHASRDGGAAPRGDALATLEQRYARGEIDDNEYQRRRNLLTQN